MAHRELGEFGLIEKIAEACRSSVPAGVTGIGDDCAVIPQRGGLDTLVSTDMLVERTHFLLDDVPARLLGHKSAAVNISDIAAMGGRPTASFLSFAIPSSLGQDWIDGFIDGYRELSERYGCPLLGGDTTSSPDRLCISVTVLGEAPSGRAKLRSAAREGDLVCVTGNLGDSGGGLKVILGGLQRGADEAELVRRHYDPQPQVAAGLSLGALPGVHAMMDISDGIGSDLRHILKASGVGARVDLAALPVSPELRRCASRHGWDLYALATGGGEDYQLLFTAAPGTGIPVEHHVIGRITAPGTGLVWEGSDVDYGGFKHF